MSDVIKKVELSSAAKSAIDEHIKKYPADQKQSAVMPALTIVQKENGGYLTESLMDAVADYLDYPRIAVYEVASFYSMYDLKPVGCHKVSLCTNVPCMLRGAEALGEHIKKKFNVAYGETTKDGKFTLKEVECLGACVHAPVMQIDDQPYCEKVDAKTADKLLDELK